MIGNTFHPQLTKDGDFVLDSSWFQGKGIYGGLVFAYFVEGFYQKTTLPIRSLQVELCRPLKDGVATLELECICKASNTEFWRGTIKQNGVICAAASSVMGQKRTNRHDNCEVQSPKVRPFHELLAIPSNPIMPAFCQHIEYRLALGSPPFSNAQSTLSGGWLQFRQETCSNPFAIQVALIDAWWPSIALQMKKLHPMGTISFSCHFFSTLPPPYLLIAQTRKTHDGYVSERNELWSQQGVLIAVAQQIIAIIR